jgi:hypothetical protein
MTAFRKKPVVIEAVLWTGRNVQEVKDFMGPFRVTPNVGKVLIDTLEGEMSAAVGDWIIRGVQGEFYPCKPDIFEATYEPAEVSA